MARFNDAQVGDKVKAPDLFGDMIGRVDEITNGGIVHLLFEDGSSIWINADGKYTTHAKNPVLFYTNDNGDLLTERPKRKVRKYYYGTINGFTDTGLTVLLSMRMPSIDELKIMLSKKTPATLIVEVDE